MVKAVNSDETRRLTLMAPRVELTNPDKVLYPVTGTTKSEIFDYYTGIAEVIVPHIAGRAATRMHWPNGVEQSSFSESSWPRRRGRTQAHRGSP